MISQMTPGGIEPGEARDIDRRLGVAGAHQHAAVPGDQREDMAGRDDVAIVLGRIDGDGDGVGAVMRGDAGRDAFPRLDRDGEGGRSGACGSSAPSARGEAARRAPA